MATEIELVFSGSIEEMGMHLLKESAERCVANGGEWYASCQVVELLRDHVGMPALLADATFIGMCSPDLILKLFKMVEGVKASGDDEEATK